MANEWSANERAYAKVISRAWVDAAFERNLLDNPAAALADYGFELPEGARVSIIRGATEAIWSPRIGAASGSSGGVLALPLPPRPLDLNDEQVQRGVGGSADVGVEVCCCCCCC
jgi:hypothetical protein